jgi:hypothetical protein
MVRRAQERRAGRMGLVALALALGLPACGGGGGGGTTGANPPPPQRVRTSFGSGSFQLGSLSEAQSSGLNKDFFVVPFSTNVAGDVEAVVDWTFNANDVDIGIMRGDCTVNGVLAGRCSTVVESLSVTAKPERVTATNLAAGSYTLLIVNEGPGRESGTYQMFITQ